MRLLTGLKAIALALLLGGMTVIDGLPTATALPTEGTRMARYRRLNFRVGVRPSRYRIGSISRSGRCGGTEPLSALVPPPQSRERLTVRQAMVDKTVSDHPTFFVYIPVMASKTAQFTLKNEAETDPLYSKEFELPDKAGIVGISLPTSAPALQVGQKYFWQVAVVCDPDEPSKLITIGSWIERVNPSAVPPGSNRLIALAEQGIWQDVVTQVALQRYQQPADRSSAEDWAALMEDVGLSQFKQAEVVQIVQE